MLSIKEAKERVLKFMIDVLGVTNPQLELTSIRVSAILTPESGGIYKIDLRHSKARKANVDVGVADADLFFGFGGGLFLSKEKAGQAGSGILVPYVDGAIFDNRPEAGESEFNALMSTFNGNMSITDSDGTQILIQRPTFDFLATPQKQYVPHRAGVLEDGKTLSYAITESLPQFSKDDVYQPFEPMVVVSGRKETILTITQGEGDKSNVKGAAGTQNVLTFIMLGIKVRNQAEKLSLQMASTPS